MKQGKLIVLEGLDGAGTTTQTELLAAALRKEGFKVLTTRQPSDGPIGTLLRQALTRRLSLPSARGPLTPETLALLFAADRVDHLAAQIDPAVERGEVVICDRYVLSSLAYQGSELEMAFVEEINSLARPADLTLFLKVSPGTAARRRAGRGGEEELFDAVEKQKRIARKYQAAIGRRGKRERVVTVDGNRSVAEVTGEVVRVVLKELGRKG